MQDSPRTARNLVGDAAGQARSTGANQGGQGDAGREMVDEMKIQTMYRMVEEISVSCEGRDIRKKILYLTNKQCSMFNEDGMRRCIEALDMGQPKCIIRLLNSVGGPQTYAAHAEAWNKSDCLYRRIYAPEGCEICSDDAEVVSRQLDLFMKTCILPLAQETRALIICAGANDCAMSAALERVVVPEQGRLGEKCPFTVLSYVAAHRVHYNASSEIGIAGRVAKGSQTWSNRLNVLSSHFAAKDLASLQRCDLNVAASHMLIFESIDLDDTPGSVNSAPSRNFQQILTTTLTSTIPSISIQMDGIHIGLNNLADLVRAKVPTLLIDTRERAISLKGYGRKTCETQLARETNQFPRITQAESQALLHELDHGFSNNSMDAEILSHARHLVERQLAYLAERGIQENYMSGLIAFFHNALQLCGQSDASAGDATVPLWKRIQDIREREQANSSNNVSSAVPTRIAALITDYILSTANKYRRQADIVNAENFISSDGGEKHKALVPAAKAFLNKVNSSASKELYGIDRSEWVAVFDILTSASTFSASIHDLDGVNKILASVARIDRLPKSNSIEALLTIQDAYDHANIYNDLSSNYKVVTKLSYIVLLACGIAITTLGIFSQCTELDGFDDTGDTVMRYTVLGLSVLVSAIASLIAFISPVSKWQYLRGAALNIQSHIWKFRTRSNEYRLNTESDFDHSADELLREEVENIKIGVTNTADISNTSLFGRVKSPNYHKQHSPTSESFGFGISKVVPEENISNHDSRGAKTSIEAKDTTTEKPFLKRLGSTLSKVALSSDEDVSLQELVDQVRGHSATSNSSQQSQKLDNNYGPMLPGDYCKHRVVAAIKFYKSRIPRYYRNKVLTKVLMLLGSAAGVIFAYLDALKWAAVVSVVTTAMTAWIEFDGVDGKIRRYSDVVDSLQKLLVWWKTRPPIEKSASENIDKLIGTCEDLIQNEQSAWSTTSQVLKRLSREVETATEGNYKNNNFL